MRQDIPLRQLMAIRAASRRIPVTGGFELTPRCNFNCKMCYIRMSEKECTAAGRELTAEQWLEMGRQAVENGTLFLLLTGGEPFLRTDFREIYLGLTRLGLSVSINSNGTLIDDRAIAWLRESPPAQINITLYGSSRETYAALCGDPTGFDRTVRAIDKLREAGILVALNATMTPLNAADMRGIAEFGLRRGLRVKPTFYLFPPHRRSPGEPCAMERLDPETAGRLTAEAQWLTETPEKMRRFAEMQSEDPYLAVTDECAAVPGAPLGCLAGASQFWISWKGDMMPCGMMNEPSAAPLAIGFEAAWRQITEATQRLRLPAACVDCTMKSACPNCAAINACETGHTHERPEYLCRMTLEYIRTLKTLAEE